ncbi:MULTISPECIES: MFS transporter [unclassified Shinella]|jgi:MFS family permease|uniref:MFS transporter n=1 Tax=unclassified Shinella TaxID=2643062 RepID=UPI00234E4B60|nr:MULTISPECIES: MFS transporter [unclassified Shinella]MCO5150306.1 MFS transporter [Shinella sp.]MDC7261253.1 MFS transporter [Shinella sp. HY16]MDC7268148.1 MFS transporter [Shinella sp. YZ44]
MSDSVTIPKDAAPRLSSLFSRAYLFSTLMLGGGIMLHAVETYITATLMPSIVRDIGGLSLFAWATTIYVAASVLGSTFVAVRPERVTLNHCYRAGALLFGIGSLVCAVAPTMETVLAGRAVQGLGAGFLVALGYAFIRHVYPEPLWSTASTLYAAAWGIATFLGPTIGGIFAAGSAWREAFALLVPLSVLMTVAAPRLLPSGEGERVTTKTPFLQIALLVAAVVVLSFASSVAAPVLRGAFAAAAVLAVLATVAIERRAEGRLLPAGTISLGSPLARVYLIMLLLLVTICSDIYIPYFLQVLHGVSPLVSGYLVALLALGWTIAAFATAGLKGRRANRVIVAGALIETLATVLLVVALARHNPASGLVLLTIATVFIFLMGFGIGMGWAHLVTLVLHLAPPGETDKASAAITTMQALGAAFGAALAGVIVNSTGLVHPGGVDGALTAARWLYALLALPAAVGILLALRLPAARGTAAD